MKLNAATESENEVADEKLTQRLRDARKSSGLSRAQVAKQAGIPAKSIEKFEFGNQEPSASRLMKLAEIYGTTVNALLGIDPEEAEEDGELDEDQDVKPASKRSTAARQETDSPESGTDVQKILDELDGLRNDGFTSHRRAMKLIEDAKRQLGYLEPDELTELAEDRGVFMGECPESGFLDGLFHECPADAQNQCGEIEERIIDTAVLGVDLFAIEHSALEDLAERLEEADEIEGPGLLGSWGDHCELAEKLSPALRTKAIAGDGEDFSDREMFPRREGAEKRPTRAPKASKRRLGFKRH